MQGVLRVLDTAFLPEEDGSVGVGAGSPSLVVATLSERAIRATPVLATESAQAGDGLAAQPVPSVSIDSRTSVAVHTAVLPYADSERVPDDLERSRRGYRVSQEEKGRAP